MSKRESKNRTKATPARTTPAETPLSPALFAIGLVLLLICVASSGMLVAQHFGGLALPGCGPDSGCARAASSIWGKVPLPGLQWPVSFIGLAYFLGVTAAFLGCRGGIPAGLLWLVRLGALASVGFLVIMVIGGYFCPYCAVAHVANVAFAVTLEVTRSSRRSGSPARLATVAGLFVACTVVLLLMDRAGVARAQETAEQELARSTQEIAEAAAVQEPEQESLFTGRYRIGPDKAPVRLVIISDYQCPDCKKIEQQVRDLLDAHENISFSAKHFPMCTDCNSYMQGSNPHPNACWAARAAETAGIMRGDEGFWEMHHWLFDREGNFTNEELTQGLHEMGYDVEEFKRIMQTRETLELVQQDIEEARNLGLHFTPMVFINGVELTGWTAPNAVIRAVTSLLQAPPPALGAEVDHPQPAHEKYVSDWRGQPTRNLSATAGGIVRGPANAPARIVVWGDLQATNTAELDAEIRRVMERGDVSYRFMHYPVNQECNPIAVRSVNDMACLAAQAMEAAGQLGGADAYWGMYDWIMANQSGLSEPSIMAAAADLGLDEAAMRETMEGAAVSQIIVDDARAARQLGARFIPMIYINDKWVPRYRLEGHDILGRIVSEAAGANDTSTARRGPPQ